MRKGNGKIGNFVNWAESRYGGSVDEKQPSTQQSPPIPQPIISYDLRNNRIYPDQNQETNEISQAKMRIARAREENLALKRIIVQKNLQNNQPMTNPSDLRSIPFTSSKQGSNQKEQYSSPTLSSTQESNSIRPYQNPDSSQSLRATSNEPIRHSPPTLEPTNLPLQAPLVPIIHSPPITPLTQNEPSSSHPLSLPPSHPSKENLISKKKQKKQIRKEKETEQRDLLSQSIADLKRFSSHLDAAIDDNKKLLLDENPLLTNSESKYSDLKLNELEREKKKRKKMEEKQRRQKLKLQMDSLLRGQVLNILPLWRHRLRGNVNPKPEEILKGKSLFRVGYLMVMHFYVKPRLTIHHRKAQTKASEMDSLLKSLLLFTDNTGHWLGKLVKLPVSSIIQVNLSSFLTSSHPLH
jgi:hypothetical protein